MVLALLRVSRRLAQVVGQEGGAPDWSLGSTSWIDGRGRFTLRSDVHCDRFRAIELRWRACRHSCSCAHAPRRCDAKLGVQDSGKPSNSMSAVAD